MSAAGAAVPVVDARGMLCPLPVLRLRKALAALPEGGRVRLWASDPMAMVDVPHYCGQAGHVMLQQRDLADGAQEFVVERGRSTHAAQGRHTPEDI